MATFRFNNGNDKEIKLSSMLAKVFVTAEIEVKEPAVKIAGHSIVNLDGDVSIEDVQFENHALLTGNKLVDKKLAVVVDVSKFKVEEKELKDSDFKVTCKLSFSTKTSAIEECIIDDGSNPEPNSVFIYVFSFSKE